MRKFIAGFIVGGVMAMALPVSGGSVVGRVVQATMPLAIDGARVAQEVAIIDGTSYLPLRVVADLFSYDITFLAKEQRVVLTRKLSPSYPVVEYEVRSNVPGLIIRSPEQSYGYVELDGDAYLSHTPLSGYLKYDGDTTPPRYTFTFPGKQSVVLFVGRDQKYTKGVDGFRYGGYTYVRLSALGLRAVVQGDVLWLE